MTPTNEQTCPRNIVKISRVDDNIIEPQGWLGSYIQTTRYENTCEVMENEFLHVGLLAFEYPQGTVVLDYYPDQ